MSKQNISPGISLGSYPQKQADQLTELEQNVANFFKQLKIPFTSRTHSQKYITRKVNQYQQTLEESSEQELTQITQQLRNELHHKGLTKPLIFKTFAVIREAASRILGKSHYDVQLYGGWLMINGMLAEMETGEGKTLTSTLPACTAALAGIPVHVITANDYLAARDCEIMLPLYQRLGLTAASVVDGMETQQRQENYSADIVHTTNKQLAFDYLRDRIEMASDTGALRFQYRQIQNRQSDKAPLLLRGLCFALIDEADSV
ncbi:MAG: prepilin peptidase, partial [Gammaproteobacteria bacterium]|nr:prepilin peptidase [Gammaproteobacteria bacterium]